MRFYVRKILRQSTTELMIGESSGMRGFTSPHHSSQIVARFPHLATRH